MNNVLDVYFKRMADMNRIGHAFLICNTNLDNLKESLIKILSDYFFDYNVKLENDSDIYIIRPVNGVIPKEEILALQAEFKNKSQFNDNRVYIIDHAELMNDSSANSLLKFLEEPLGNIYAFLITSNINKVISTIKSRCQVIIATNEVKFSLDSYDKDKVSKVVDFVNRFENIKSDVIAYLNEYFDKKIEKEDFSVSLEIIKYFYRDVLNYNICESIMHFTDYMDVIKSISLKNDKKSIINKLIVLNKYENMLEYNVNLNLFLDDLILEMEETVNYE